MVGAGNLQWSSRGTDALQNALGANWMNRRSGGEQLKEKGKTDTNWHKVVDCLITIVGDLKKLEEDAPRVGILRGA